ncbi:uncharacterized protein LOC111344273 [Stylophora pistillata]|uniref:uncharacterized protein LOC111344273 n=1 Tax=Stylophora pistillata TaxID=50429 RepID=UPI000C046092|nr:uncharacterized protein LOC111344273 [Stylophora pistillata]
MKLISFVVLLLSFSVAFGINCYKCASYRSQEDCNNNRKETECSPNNYCAIQTEEYRTVSGIELEYYQRDCTFHLHCNGSGISKLKACKEAKGTCWFKCCFTDLCNDSNAVLVVSTFLMLTCVFLGLIHRVA